MTARRNQHGCESQPGAGQVAEPHRTRILLAKNLLHAGETIDAVIEAFGDSTDITLAGTFADALERAADATHFDLVLISQTLPGTEEHDAIAAIKSALPTAHVAVLSDSCRRADVLAAFKHGANAYLHSRMTRKALIHALRLALEGEKFVPWAAVSDVWSEKPIQHDSPRWLSPRERQVLTLLKQGMSNRDIAISLGIKGSTVNTYLGALYNKLGVVNRGQLIACDGDKPKSLATPVSGGPGEVGLSTRDQAVLAMLEKQLSNREIARQLGMPVATLKYNLGRLYAKLGAATRAQAVHIAARYRSPLQASTKRKEPNLPHHNTTISGDPDPGRSEPTTGRGQSAGLQIHPKRMEGLTRGMARCQEELRGMRREAMIALEDAISQLGALDRCSRPGVESELLADLKAALDEVRILDHDTLPRPEHFFAIADRLDRLNEMLPASSVVASGGPADTGDERRPSPDSSGLHDTTP